MIENHRNENIRGAIAACSLQGVTSDPPGYPTFYEAWDGSDCSEYYYLFFIIIIIIIINNI